MIKTSNDFFLLKLNYLHQYIIRSLESQALYMLIILNLILLIQPVKSVEIVCFIEKSCVESDNGHHL